MMGANSFAQYLTGLVGGAAIALIATSASADQLKIGVLLPGPVTDNGYDADGGRAADALKSQLHADTQITENVSRQRAAGLRQQGQEIGRQSGRSECRPHDFRPRLQRPSSMTEHDTWSY